MASTFAVASNVAATFPSFSGTASRSRSSSSVGGGRAKVSCNAATISIKAERSFRQFEGLRGEGSLASVQAFGGVPYKTEQSRRSSVRVAATAASPPAVAAPSKQKIRIKLRSYWVHLIQQACQQILDAAKSTNAETMGPVPLPTHKRIYCVLRSPHVDKDSREHFEIRTHRRLIDVANPNAQTIDALMQLDLPAGVDVEVKL